jgi:hypothetical protein
MSMLRRLTTLLVYWIAFMIPALALTSTYSAGIALAAVLAFFAGLLNEIRLTIHRKPTAE